MHMNVTNYINMTKLKQFITDKQKIILFLVETD